MISYEPLENFSPRFDVVSCFVEHDNHILLLHRQDHKPQGNTWGVPAGKVEAGEDITTAIIREVEEELNLRLDPSKLVYHSKTYVRHDGYDFIYHMFVYTLDNKPEIVINEADHKTYLWARPANALKMNLIPDEDFCIKLVYNVD